NGAGRRCCDHYLPTGGATIALMTSRDAAAQSPSLRLSPARPTVKRSLMSAPFALGGLVWRMLWPVSMYSVSTLADQRALIATSVPPPAVQPITPREARVAVLAVGMGVKPSSECTQAAPPVTYRRAGPVVV